MADLSVGDEAKPAAMTSEDEAGRLQLGVAGGVDTVRPCLDAGS
jgi:hypothetical protein